MTDIGSLNEKPLHAALKDWYRRPGDRVEEPLGDYVIDLVRDELLIEIQTAGFGALRRKLDHLLDEHPIRVVHPVAAINWIVKLDSEGNEVSRRKSPKRGTPADVCAELVSFPTLMSHPNFELDVLLVEKEEVRRPDSRRGRRRGGYVVEESRLLRVLESARFSTPGDLLTLLPPGLPEPFTTADVADGLGRGRRLGQQLAYCLRESGVIEAIEREARGVLYRLA